MRIAVIGDDGVGKSTLITCLFKDRYVPNIEDVLPPLAFPRPDGTRVVVADTSPALQKRDQLLHELRQSNCIWLIFSDHYTMERIALFWLPFLRTSGVNLPIILCQNKQDQEQDNVNEEEDVIRLMQDFKEIESFVRCSARNKRNVNEAFYLCQRAIAYPLAPLFDSKLGQLKPLAAEALARVFFLSDDDQSGVLTESKMQRLQQQAFDSKLDSDELTLIKETLINIGGNELYCEARDGLTERGFLTLAQLYCERGRHETVWAVLRAFRYTDSLSLDDELLHPQLTVDERSRVELSPNGYQFLVELFTLFDKDNDGGLSPGELTRLFTPNDGIPELWKTLQFPQSCLRNHNGFVTLQGWLAQWTMFVHLDARGALACLATLGYLTRTNKTQLKSAIRITKPARQRNRRSRVYWRSTVQDRQVFYCAVLGRPNSGKSTLLASFLGLKNDTASTCVNSVEMLGGKQCYLILAEPTELTNLDRYDVLCLTYDSSDPDSFNYLDELRQAHPELDDVPVVYAALKADLDRAQQRCAVQPDEYTAQLGVAAPMHVSSHWPASLTALFVQLVDAAMHPGTASVKLAETPDSGWIPELAIGAGVVLGCYLYSRWRRYD